MRVFKITRSGLRLAIMALLALFLTTFAFADDGCNFYFSECQDGSSSWSQVCCDSNSQGYAVCNCNSWNSDTGYSDCGNYATGCYAVFIMTP